MTTITLEATANYLQHGGKKPSSKEVVAALLAAEKQSRQEKTQYQYEDLIGTWRLGFVSGTQTVRSGPNTKPIKRPGKGLFLPKLVKVEITYSVGEPPIAVENTNSEANRPNVRLNSVSNEVSIGPLQLCLSGPTRFWPKPNALAFDFTNAAASLGSWTPYSRQIRGGKDSLSDFGSKSLKNQAFFTFFQVEEHYIAARGKGGGLALWTRQD